LGKARTHCSTKPTRQSAWCLVDERLRAELIRSVDAEVEVRSAAAPSYSHLLLNCSTVYFLAKRRLLNCSTYYCSTLSRSAASSLFSRTTEKEGQINPGELTSPVTAVESCSKQQLHHQVVAGFEKRP
jgi:hypothetical protein